MSEIRVKDIIAPAFYDMYRDMKAGGHDTYWLEGGRGSTKSSFLSIVILLGMLRDKNANALILRRVGGTIKDSVFAQMQWAIDKLNMNNEFRCLSSPYEIIHKKTGQRIMFRGLDDPMKLKSIKLTKGYFKYLWFEELAEYRNMEDIRSITQSAFRGVDEAFSFYSYNPPKSANAWVNAEALVPHDNRYVHRSTYLDVPPEWLGKRFIAEAEDMKKSNPLLYDNVYLGKVTGSGGNVFENVTLREVPDDEIDMMQWFYQGIDWGFFPDPDVWIRCAYDAKDKRLYLIDEEHGNKLSNRDFYERIKDRLRYDENIIADSAEPKSIADFRSYGAVQTYPSNKAAVGKSGSVDYSMKWLATLREIVIDPKRCPLAAKEFTAYEYERNSAGEFISGYVDADNHSIDAVRYAMSLVWRRSGQ